LAREGHGGATARCIDLASEAGKRNKTVFYECNLFDGKLGR
jgi:hypothetical protein